MAFIGRHSLRKYATIWLASLCLIVANVAVAQDVVEQLPEPSQGQSVAEELPSRTIPSGDSANNPLSAPVLTIDHDRLFAESAWGKRAVTEFEEAGLKIERDNERIIKQLSDEEADLTEQRENLDPAEFRKKAEAFDLRATEIRRERTEVVQKLSVQTTEDRNAFFRAVLPIMGEVMERRQAVVVLDRRTIFVSVEAVDITNELIVEIDARIGAGPIPNTTADVPKEVEDSETQP